jgi:general secretion pathway protein G
MKTLSTWMKRTRGFTLLELLTVMTILAMLATVGIVGYRHSIRTSKEAVLKENLFLINHALEQYRADRGNYPTGLDDLKSVGYLRDIPVDPVTGQREWMTELATPDTDKPDAEVGIFRVRSTSQEVSSSGQPYNEW